jgi:hypothetical protein
MAAMHHILAMILSFLFGKVVLTPVWNYGKQLVQALALYYLFGLFVLSFVVSYTSQPHPIAGPDELGRLAQNGTF